MEGYRRTEGAAPGVSRRLAAYLRRQSFQPGALGVLLNPFYFARRGLFAQIRALAPRLRGRVLDFGCGRKPYRPCFTAATGYVGVDLARSGHDHASSLVDVFYDGRTVPFADGAFDAVFCSEVLEHVFEPDATLAELHRVLKDGGAMLITVPFCWNEHEAPYDFGRYASFGLIDLLTRHGFEVVEQGKTGHFVQVIFQLAALYVHELARPVRPVALRYLLSMLLIAPINVAGALASLLLPVERSLYFSNVLLLEKRGARQAPGR
jgi:SAM-dependent methyltransferase